MLKEIKTVEFKHNNLFTSGNGISAFLVFKE